MNGKDLRKKLVDEGIGLCDLAHKLGYDHEQNLYSLFRASDIRTGLIEKLAKTLGKPIGWFYGEDISLNVSASNKSIAVSGDNNSVATISERFIGLLEKKNEQMDELIGIIKNQTK